MASSVDTLVDQSVQRADAAGVKLGPELVELMRTSYKGGALSQITAQVAALPASIPGGTAVTYSGVLQGKVPARALAQAYAQSEPGSYIIDNTAVGQYLGDEGTWTGAMRSLNSQLAGHGQPPISDKERFFVQEPAWRAASERFAEQAHGPMVSLVREPARESAFVQNELPITLANPKIPSVNGVPTSQLAKSASPVMEIAQGAEPIYAGFTSFNTSAGRVIVKPGQMSTVERTDNKTDRMIALFQEAMRAKGASESDIQRAGVVVKNELTKRSGDQQKAPTSPERHEKVGGERAR
ncbi:hypothetical protein [Caballeronia sordidicola]|uniref:Uncharacterized protein n=1 Tax=Caballeronia sordidicola TaxID=196367 RepID=A0A242MVR6_CABSO|nr:hypothetical protein [Caballeronia sordidicola]OTP75413.1 hypothetical protein PAMC26577_13390 [Caballeronia sordidicola]